jgi:hypothetical protein
VATSRSWRAGYRVEGGSKPRNPPREEEEIQDFWGQLWFFPNSKPNPDPARVRARRGENLVWVRRDLWRAKTFVPSDCYPVGEGDLWIEPPSKLKFAELFWGDEKKASFAQVVKGAMAGRGRGRGPRPRTPEEDWERWGEGGWNQYLQFPQPPPPPHFYSQPPLPPYGFYPNQHPPLMHPPNQAGFSRQFDGPRPRGGGLQGRGRGRQQQPPRIPQNQAQHQAQVNREPARDVAPMADEVIHVANAEGTADSTKESNLQVVCFNCTQIGHFSSACTRPRVCFICHSTEHMVDVCPEWKKPAQTAQYFGSASKELGFCYIDVEDRDDRFSHWIGMDNFGVITIEEGDIDEEGILENLRELFDKNWKWQLKKSDEYKYIVRFPPDRKVENLVIGKASVFDLNRSGVAGSLSVWNGEVEPIGNLIDVWVQIQGIPPKWVDWKTL